MQYDDEERTVWWYRTDVGAWKGVEAVSHNMCELAGLEAASVRGRTAREL